MVGLDFTDNWNFTKFLNKDYSLSKTRFLLHALTTILYKSFFEIIVKVSEIMIVYLFSREMGLRTGV